MRRSPSKGTLASDASTAASASTDSLASASTAATSIAAASTATAVSGPRAVTPVPAAAKPPPGEPEMPLVHAANAALLERPAFAIDDAGDEDEYDEDVSGDHEGVMDEVRPPRAVLAFVVRLMRTQVDAFLEAHDSGLSEADKALQKGTARVTVTVWDGSLTLLRPRLVDCRADEVVTIMQINHESWLQVEFFFFVERCADRMS
jgi:hypothetical protein